MIGNATETSARGRWRSLCHAANLLFEFHTTGCLRPPMSARMRSGFHQVEDLLPRELPEPIRLFQIGYVAKLLNVCIGPM